MKRLHTLAAMLLIILATATSSLKAQSIYLWFDGVKGSTQVAWPGLPTGGATQLIELSSAGVTAACATCTVVPSPSPTPTGGKVAPGKFVFNLTDGQALMQFRTMLFKQSTTTGSVCFVFRKATGGSSSGANYYHISLGDVRVLEIDEAAAAGSTNTFQVSLAYGQIQYTYKPQKPDGSFGAPLVTGWDFIKNVALTNLSIPTGL